MKQPHNPGLSQAATNKIPYFVISEKTGKYQAAKALTEAQIIKAAKSLLDNRFKPGQSITSPELTAEWFRNNLMDLEHEVFACLFLDNQHRVIQLDELFRGTIDGASVYPREVVKKALHHNAAAVIFAHNHPSGVAEPSQADRHITDKLKQALALFDIRVLDHFIIGDGLPYSFAEHGLL